MKKKYICDYGCNQEAHYQMSNGRWCCCKSWNSCSAMKEINKQKQKELYRDPNSVFNSGEFKRKKIEGIRKASKKIGESTRRAHRDPKSGFNSIQCKNRKSKCMKKLWDDPNSIFNSKKYRKKLSEGLLNRLPECGEKISKARKKQWADPNHTYNTKEYSNKLKASWTSDRREKYSKLTTELWKNPIFQKKIFTALVLKPTKPEIFLFEILQELFPNQYRYIGNFKFWINGKNPDFIHKTKNKIIELFGTYFHSEKLTGVPEEQHEQERIKHFKEHGFDTLIIWEHELKNPELVKDRISNFNKE